MGTLRYISSLEWTISWFSLQQINLQMDKCTRHWVSKESIAAYLSRYEVWVRFWREDPPLRTLTGVLKGLRKSSSRGGIVLIVCFQGLRRVSKLVGFLDQPRAHPEIIEVHRCNEATGGERDVIFVWGSSQPLVVRYSICSWRELL